MLRILARKIGLRCIWDKLTPRTHMIYQPHALHHLQKPEKSRFVPISSQGHLARFARRGRAGAFWPTGRGHASGFERGSRTGEDGCRHCPPLSVDTRFLCSNAARKPELGTLGQPQGRHSATGRSITQPREPARPIQYPSPYSVLRSHRLATIDLFNA